MSVVKAILFYSKHDKKSSHMKDLIEKMGADLDTISVDSAEIKDMLLADERFGINKVPTVLVLYSNGTHKTYTKTALDSWFKQLIQNINDYQVQQQAERHPPPVEEDYTPLSTSETNVPKPLRRRPARATSIPSKLPSPGSGIRGSGMVGGSGGVGGARSAMISEHIKGSEPTIPITSDPMVQPGRKEVKTEGLSAAEKAKQLAEQRELYDEKVEENRPFM